MGGSGGPTFSEKWNREIAAREAAVKAEATQRVTSVPEEAKAPNMSDQAIRDAILAERNRSLTGNSRRQAFAVGNPNVVTASGLKKRMVPM